MGGRILILGAAGRLGLAAAEAFQGAGWSVTSVVRPGTAARALHGSKIAEIDAFNSAALAQAARGHDVVLHALNLPYPSWAQYMLPLTYGAIEAAETSAATFIFPGNLYNYGAGMPAVLDENTPMQPTTRKGLIRVLAEHRIREATERGMRAIILRAGDFYGSRRGSWFDLVIAKDLANGRMVYPGPLNVTHEWAYLPDFAAAMARLADIRGQFAPFETFGFAGHAVTGDEMIAAVERALKRKVAIKPMGWWLVQTVGQLFPMGRELAELAYLWKAPHRIDGAKLKAALGEMPVTAFTDAIAATLRELGLR